ncbi:MAG TPA: FAD:protein FMN transferase, partial [Candidatus Sulfotelmatobacter sp.]|nr:FAD:protein FMN transferase [Candidatus Sulfotelmatobacter sp.]
MIPRPDDAIARRTWSALGTSCTVLVAGWAALEPACTAVEAVLDDVDRTYSRFRHDAELVRLNRAGRPMQVSPLLAEAITAALMAARWTGGAVDPTVGRAMRAIGYDIDFTDLAGHDRPPRLTVEAVPGWRALRFEAITRRVTLPRGVELDLGSVGKALAADRAAQAAR